jgi:hypothetical protein
MKPQDRRQAQISRLGLIIAPMRGDEKVETLDRRRVREAFEKRFPEERMAQDYLAIYRGLPGVRTESINALVRR